MWWKCEVRFFRTILRLKVWARSEPEARGKILRMYQVATIEDLAPADKDALLPCKEPLPKSEATCELVKPPPQSARAADSITAAESSAADHREYPSCVPTPTRQTPAWLLAKP
jgi:hypothetical protein